MLSFQNDYQEGAHEKILARLIETNLEPLSGYGSDPYCESAKKKIQTACDCPEADVWFLTGGTQTNQTIIDTMLEPYEGVVSAETGHVASHEAGAIEYSGHKVLTIPQHEGKIDAAELETFLRKFWEDGNHEHMVFPGMVYISIRQNTVLFIPKWSLKICPPSVTLTIFHSFWTVHVSDTDWRLLILMSHCRILHAAAMSSTSVAQKSALCAARL